MTDKTALNGRPRVDPFARSGLIPGFNDPVAGAQSTFRAMLDALSHPGRVIVLDDAVARPGRPASLSIAMTAMLLTLVDSDTALWLPAGIDEATRQFLRFHCACAFVDEPADAQFAAVPAGFSPPAIRDCHQGDPAYPDRSTTLLIDVVALRSMNMVDAEGSTFDGHTDALVTLAGPGIEDKEHVVIDGLNAEFWPQWQRQRSTFPLGVDVFFCQDATLCGLPRTTRVET